MSPAELLRDLSNLGVELWSEGEQLRFRAPKGVLTPSLREELAARRAELALLLNGKKTETGSSILPANLLPDPANRHQPFPLTEIQQAYWIGRGNAFELGNVAAHTYVELEREGLDLDRLGDALQRVIDRHDMLRSVVMPDGRQRILPEAKYPEIRCLDLRGLPPAAAFAEIEELRLKLTHQVLSLEEWPPFDIWATLLDGNRVRLHVSFDLMVCDAWSFQIFFHELAALYQDPEADLPEIEISFRDFVLAAEKLRDSARYRRALDYWRRRQESLPPAPQLPLAVNPASIVRPRFVRRSGHLDRPAWDRLQANARQNLLTPSGVLLAAFADVLAAWSRSPRFTLNLTVFNRPPWHKQIDRIVGDFTSTSLLTVDHSQETFAARAGALQNQLWEDLEHSAVTGIEVLRQRARTKGAGTAAMPIVFTSILQQQKSNWEADARAVLGDVVFGISQTPQVWLDHQVMEQDGNLVWNWDAVEEVFPEGVLDAMFDVYNALLTRLAGDETAWREPARALPPEDQLRRRDHINNTQAPLPEGLLYSAFLEHARRQPTSIAVISPGLRLTYGELYQRAAALGHALREHGAGAGGLVAVVMEKGWEQVVAVLGVLSTGAAYLPIDPGLPAERIAYLFENAGARLAVTQPAVDARAAWPSTAARLLVQAEPAPARSEWPEGAVSPGSLAYVIYTSGSTGSPKGVMIDHRGALNTITDVNRRFAVGPGDRIFGLSALNFDLSVYDLFGALAAGAALVLPGPADIRDPERWLHLLEREGVTIWNSVPTLMEMLVESGEGSSQRLPESLRLVLLSGDWIPVGLPDRVRTLAPRASIIAMGGATEASIWSILYPVGRVVPEWKSIPYGRPMLNQTFHVLNELLDPCPDWVTGELFIGGAGLTLGYWRDPEQTAKRLITHPRTRERLYRTGDLGRYLPDGNIEFLGREDFQVKIQGHRIELGEIEAALVQHPQIREAIVAAPLLSSGQRQLVAYVVPSGKTSGGLFTEESGPGGGDQFWRGMVDAGLRKSRQLPEELAGAASALQAAERVARGYMCSALRSMGAFSQAGERHTLEELCRELGVLPRYHRLLGNWLRVLATAGLLVEGADGAVVCPSPLPLSPTAELERELGALGAVSDRSEHILDYLRRSGASLPALLRGETEALELFFPDGSWERAESLYQTNPVAAYHNGIAAEIVAALATASPVGQKLRILELGAGTGGTTASILPLLPADRTEYVYTDVSSFFTRQAKEKFRAAPFLRSAVLDINQDPARQGFSPHSFDLVLGANVVHNARNMPSTIAWIRSLLTPDGVLALLEGTRNTHVQMVSVGFLEGFGQAGGEGAEGLPLLGAEQWGEALLAGGFVECAWFPEADSPHGQLGQHVIVARAPGAVRRLDRQAASQFLAAKLPSFMVPTAFVALGALPLSANGKVDRKALPLPEQETSEHPAEHTAPRNQMEADLARIWAEVLGLERVGVHSNFFELGGDSLLATQVIRKAREQCRIEAPLRRLFETPTVAGLARAAAIHGEAGTEIAEEQDLPRVKPAVRDRHLPFPLTDVQQAYWLGRTNAFELGGVATQNYLEIDVAGLDLGRFELAWRRLIDRHDMLRSVIHPDGRQQILEHVPPYRIRTADLQALPAGEADARLLDTRERLSHEASPTDSWPLFDIRITQLGNGRTRIHYRYDALIGDAWSAVVLSRDFALLYEDPQRALPPIELSFRDYVMSLEELSQSPAFHRAEEYWRSKVTSLPAAPELPLAADPASMAPPRFLRYAGELQPELWQEIKRRAGPASLTPSVVLLAAFAQVLAVWSKSRRFTLNLTLFNRLPLHPQVNEIIGDFTSLILLAVEGPPDERLRERARRLQDQLWQGLDHRYVSGVRVLREMARQGGGTRGAAMPVVFTSALGLPDMERDLFSSGLEGQVVYGISQTPQVWLDHQVMEQGGALIFNWDVVEGLFPPGMVEDMFAAYRGLLGDLAESEAAWERRGGWLLPEAQRREREAANATTVALPQGLLQDGFVQQAAQGPERTAVVCGQQRISYGELRRLSLRIGGWLRERGAGPNRLVGVVMEKGWEQVAGVLGVLESGAAYLPVDVGLPGSRIEYLLANGGVRLVLTQRRWVERVRWPEGIECLVVEEGMEGGGEGSGAGAAVGDLAYVIYTSGSTGEPKGVMIDHRGARNTIEAVNRRVGMGESDGVLGVSSLSFDLSVWDIFGTLGAGGTLVLPEAGAERDPERWLELVEEEGVTVWNSVPALMELLVEAVARGVGGRKGGLRTALLSGDWIPVGLAGRMKELGVAEEAISLGGATEASIWSIWHRIEEGGGEWSSVPYGKPLENQQFHVLNEAQEACPEWVTGELYIGGVGLAQGYWGDAGKTAERFVEHGEYGRLYRTGDLGRYRPGGEIEFLGREDQQVKIQGHRIELGEIEAALQSEEKVREAVVTARAGVSGHKRLVAYVVGEEGVSGAELRERLEGKLPGYMVPADWVLLEKMPLTSNGKVDRAGLPEPGRGEGESEGFAEPRSPVERELARLWAETLGLPCERVGIHQRFLASGGDSLLAVQFVAAANQAGYRISLRELFRLQTIAGLAGTVEETSAPASLAAFSVAGAAPASSHVPALPRQAPLPTGVRHHGQNVWDAVVEAGRAQARALPPEIDFDALAAGFGFLDRLSNAYVCRALLSLGAFRQGGESHTLDEAAGLCHIVPGYHKLLRRWLNALVEDGLLAYDGQRYGCAAPLAGGSVEGIWLESGSLSLKAPEPVIRYLKRSGESLSDIVSGRTHPLEVFFEGGTTEVQEWLYQQGPGMAYLNAVAGAILQSATQAWPADCPIRILEVGAGIGGTTAWLLPVLPSAHVSYSYTDLSNYFTNLARRKFRDYPFVQYGLLNIEQDPVAQGYSLHGFDIVIAANVLHGARDLTGAVEHVRSLLSEGGILLLLEGTRNDRLHNFTVGLIEGWSRFDDQRLGSNLPLLPVADWQEVLGRQGFVDMAVFPESGSPAEIIGQNVIVARLAKAGAREPAALASAGPGQPQIAPAPETRGDPFPLTDVQQAYWIGRSGSFALGNVAAHIYLELDCPDLDLGRFAQAWRRLVERHEMLRAVVLPDGRQRILAEVPPYQPAILDVSAQADSDASAELARVRDRMSHQVLDAGQWPLFEIVACRLPRGDLRLHISFDLLIADGWSLQLLARELVQVYQEPGTELEPIALSFRDYVLAEAALENSEPFRQAREYWLARLETLPPGPALALARGPESIGRPSFVRFGGSMEAASWLRIKDAARRAGLTPSIVLCAAFTEVLGRWSRHPRFTLNLTIFNRLPLHPEVNRIVGDFTSLILLEVENALGGSFLDRAASLQRQLWADLEHRQFSGVRVLRELSHTRNAAAAVGMPVVFTSGLPLESVISDEFALERLGKVVSGITQTPQVWLDHQVMEQGGALIFNWDVVEGLFPPGMVEDMFAAYRGLLGELAESEAAWERRGGWLLPEAQRREREAANATTVALPEGLLQDGFVQQAAQGPERTAVVCGQQRISYGELRRLSLRIGGWLRERGAGPNRLVGVVMEKGWEQVAGVLGVLESGAAYLPVDVGLPGSRIEYLLANGGVRLVLTQRRWVERVRWPEGIECLVVEEGMEGGGEGSGAGAAVGDLAYVIYTSGSTGEPKGVMIDHRGARNTIEAVNRRVGMGESDGVLGVSSLSFDLSVWDIFGTLGAGGTLVLPEAGAERDPERWLELVEEEGVTVWNSVPALMELLVEAVARGVGGRKGGLRTALLSGDWIPVGLAGRMKELGVAEEAISLGGATEASIWSIWHRIEEGGGEWSSVPYGKPLENQQFHVLNEAQEACPEWVVGELYIGGVGLAQGYWGDAGKTAERFVEHGEYGRLYRTGDLGRYRPGGEIEFLGREDQQVKIQGHRIELGEIEAALQSEEKVREAVVTARTGASGHKRLVAYVVGEEGVSGAELRERLEGKLPGYMVPADWVLLEKMPLTSNGKVDRGGLPEPGRGEGESEGFAEPRSPVERELARLWAETLGRSPGAVGIHESFLEAGGDSLIAIQLVAKIKDSFELDLPLHRFFRATTIAGLGEVIEELLLQEIETMSDEEASRLLEDEG